MKLKLSSKAVSSLNELYGKQIQKLEDTTWQVALNSCGCSGDCGTNWMQS